VRNRGKSGIQACIRAFVRGGRGRTCLAGFAPRLRVWRRLSCGRTTLKPEPAPAISADENGVLSISISLSSCTDKWRAFQRLPLDCRLRRAEASRRHKNGSPCGIRLVTGELAKGFF